MVAGALGECVHVAGVSNFLRLAEKAGWRTVFLGPANSIADILEAARVEKADLVGVSYRLTAETGERLLGEFAEAADSLHASGVRFVFGGTPPVAARVEALGFFERTFDGSQSLETILAYLRGSADEAREPPNFPQSLIERIRWKTPFPLLRHHFGLPTMEATEQGIRRVAESSALDVISIGIDQDAQQNFFHPDRQNPRARGAGGVPVRSAEDYTKLYQASRHGNHPLLRTYSGTDDFIELAEMYLETIHNAWCAIPLFWFNQMDGRGPWDLQGSIEQHQRVMRWYAERNIPVELNEPHHWGMRDAPDVIFVVSAYLSAYNAQAFGVKDYIAQMMFNSPFGTSDAMDLAKMMACLQMIEPLAGPDFRIWRQTRTGLLSYPLDLSEARGHLAASIYLQMALDPHIVHVVGHTEAHHAATAEDVIEACKIAQRAIANSIMGAPDMTADPALQTRVDELVSEAWKTLGAIHSLAPSAVADALIDPSTLSRAVTTGILDAPQLKNNPFARGHIQTRLDERGACVTAAPGAGGQIPEAERLAALEL
ncbi:MAG: cobalamin B12-binding domain-containing protein [Anaerolineales bacterium]|nr:MAG: cobalamin B12-binding domain-containing protein [Anaerolineales bacterium]